MIYSKNKNYPQLNHNARKSIDILQKPPENKSKNIDWRLSSVYIFHSNVRLLHWCLCLYFSVLVDLVVLTYSGCSYFHRANHDAKSSFWALLSFEDSHKSLITPTYCHLSCQIFPGVSKLFLYVFYSLDIDISSPVISIRASVNASITPAAI